VSVQSWAEHLAPPPDHPELPERARPRWPAWNAPAALFASLGALTVVSLPLFPILVLLALGDPYDAIGLLVLLLVQDTLFVAAAVMLAWSTLKPRAWHFGIRRTRLWPTIGWAALGFGLLLGFEVGYVELLGVDETNVDEIGEDSVVGAIAVALAVIVVAPVSEEIFFRAFFYRALRTRLRVWSASLIDGIVFGALHFQSPETAVILPVIAVFGVGVCLVYERTGSIFAVIAIHAAFNTVAMLGVIPWVAVPVGVLVMGACLLLPRRLRYEPSPFGLDPRAKPIPA
jgi:membrane protease YdiL (CAAX protease family)